MLEDLISKISGESGLEKEKVRDLIQEKQRELSNLVSPEGAAYLVARELGVEIREEPKKLEIKNVVPGMRNLVLEAVVKNVFVREYEKDGNRGKYASVFLQDGTGEVRMVLWNEQVERYPLKKGDRIRIDNGFTVENDGKPEIRLGTGRIEILEQSGDVKAVVIQKFTPGKFRVCPVCKASVKERCHDRDPVERTYVSAILDDGERCFRAVFFGDQAEKLKEVKPGEELLINGRFRNGEMVVDSFSVVDPVTEIKKLTRGLI